MMIVRKVFIVIVILYFFIPTTPKAVSRPCLLAQPLLARLAKNLRNTSPGLSIEDDCEQLTSDASDLSGGHEAVFVDHSGHIEETSPTLKEVGPFVREESRFVKEPSPLDKETSLFVKEANPIVKGLDRHGIEVPNSHVPIDGFPVKFNKEPNYANDQSQDGSSGRQFHNGISNVGVSLAYPSPNQLVEAIDELKHLHHMEGEKLENSLTPYENGFQSHHAEKVHHRDDVLHEMLPGLHSNHHEIEEKHHSGGHTEEDQHLLNNFQISHDHGDDHEEGHHGGGHGHGHGGDHHEEEGHHGGGHHEEEGHHEEGHHGGHHEEGGHHGGGHHEEEGHHEGGHHEEEGHYEGEHHKDFHGSGNGGDEHEDEGHHGGHHGGGHHEEGHHEGGHHGGGHHEEGHHEGGHHHVEEGHHEEEHHKDFQSSGNGGEDHEKEGHHGGHNGGHNEGIRHEGHHGGEHHEEHHDEHHFYANEKSSDNESEVKKPKEQMGYYKQNGKTMAVEFSEEEHNPYHRHNEKHNDKDEQPGSGELKSYQTDETLLKPSKESSTQTKNEKIHTDNENTNKTAESQMTNNKFEQLADDKIRQSNIKNNTNKIIEETRIKNIHDKDTKSHKGDDNSPNTLSDYDLGDLGDVASKESEDKHKVDRIAQNIINRFATKTGDIVLPNDVVQEIDEKTINSTNNTDNIIELPMKGIELTLTPTLATSQAPPAERAPQEAEPQTIECHPGSSPNKCNNTVQPELSKCPNGIPPDMCSMAKKLPDDKWQKLLEEKVMLQKLQSNYEHDLENYKHELDKTFSRENQYKDVLLPDIVNTCGNSSTFQEMQDCMKRASYEKSKKRDVLNNQNLCSKNEDCQKKAVEEAKTRDQTQKKTSLLQNSLTSYYKQQNVTAPSSAVSTKVTIRENPTNNSDSRKELREWFVQENTDEDLNNKLRSIKRTKVSHLKKFKRKRKSKRKTINRI